MASGFGGEEGQTQQLLVRATFSSFSHPNHLEIRVLRLFCVKSYQFLKIELFFFNLATLGHKHSKRLKYCNDYIFKAMRMTSKVIQVKLKSLLPP